MPASHSPSRSPAIAHPTNRQSRVENPLTAPVHTWLTSPARSHPNAARAKELPLHLIQVILSHLDNAADLARITRTSRLFYYMALPRLYAHVTLRSYTDIRYVDGRPEGHGSGSPFTMGLNTLVTRNFTEYVQSLRLVGDWREHDLDDYKQGRVPDNNMVLQVVIRAAVDKMQNLECFAWELNVAPLHTVYQGLVGKTLLTSLTIRCQTRRIPRPTTIIPPLPALCTLVVFDIDPLCYPDDISHLLAGSNKLENLKLHWNPRMRREGEESINLLTIFGRCITTKRIVPLKRIALYNLYTRLAGDGFQDVVDIHAQREITLINSTGSDDPMTVFLDNSWRVNKPPPPPNLKMLRIDSLDKEGAVMLGQTKGLERLYFVKPGHRKAAVSKQSSAAATPSTPSIATPGFASGMTSAVGTPTMTEHQWRNLGGDYLAALQTNHQTLRHLLLSDHWTLSDSALFKLVQSLPNLEQLGFSCSVPPLESFRHVLTMAPKLWAIRILIQSSNGSTESFFSKDPEMHAFAFATETWRPEYQRLKYIGLGDDLVYKLGAVYFPPKGKEKIPEGQENSFNAKRAGPIRKTEVVSRASVKHIEIWGMDTTEFDPKFP